MVTTCDIEGMPLHTLISNLICCYSSSYTYIKYRRYIHGYIGNYMCNYIHVDVYVSLIQLVIFKL